MTAGMRAAARLTAAMHVRAAPAPTSAEIATAQNLFTARVMSWHRIVPLADNTPSPMCSCGALAAMCAYLLAAHEILGQPLPWDATDPPAPFLGA